MIHFPFLKAQGLGNDFVLLHEQDFKRCIQHMEENHFIQRLSDRHRGIGFDQLILFDDGCTIRFFNADGHEAEACGNGTRCVGFYLLKQKKLQALTLHTLAGDIDVSLHEENSPHSGIVNVTLQRPKLMAKSHDLEEDIRWLLDKELFLNTFAVDVGNPHLVIFLRSLDGIDFYTIAPQLEAHPFFDNGANISFVTMKNDTLNEKHGNEISPCASLHLKVWERGAGATLACGTAAYATSFAYHLLHPHVTHIDVEQQGGILSFHVDNSIPNGTHVNGEKMPAATWIMIGDAHIVFEGKYYL